MRKFWNRHEDFPFDVIGGVLNHMLRLAKKDLKNKKKVSRFGMPFRLLID